MIKTERKTKRHVSSVKYSMAPVVWKPLWFVTSLGLIIKKKCISCNNAVFLLFHAELLHFCFICLYDLLKCFCTFSLTAEMGGCLMRLSGVNVRLCGVRGGCLSVITFQFSSYFYLLVVSLKWQVQINCQKYNTKVRNNCNSPVYKRSCNL